MSKKQNRRAFLNRLGIGCASIGTTSLLSGITNMGLINAAAAANTSNSFFAPNPSNYKALVCILMNGGNDSYNMLIPRGTSEYADYSNSRSNLAIPQSNLLPINPITSDGKTYGLHPAMPKIQSLFENENLAFVANVGALIRPTTMNDYLNQESLPLGLYSHTDQRSHWQTSIPQKRDQLGWGGRLADILASNNNNSNISMNISLSGLNQFQLGNSIKPYTIERSNTGSIQLNKSTNTNFYETFKRQTLDSLLEVNYSNILDKAYVNGIKDAKSNSFEFSSAISQAEISNPIATTFNDTLISESLQMIAKTIAAKDILNVERQIFFVQFGGFDMHNDILNTHNELLGEFDDAMDSFYKALGDLGMQNDVTTFTISDFSRKLVSNGDGSDHGWGGNVMVMGGAVNGKEIYGSYPDLYLGNPLDTGTGRFLPTLSCDEYFAELALWYGASSSDLDIILPNITNFWMPNSVDYPIGFMS